MGKLSVFAAAALLFGTATIAQANVLVSQDFEDGDSTGWLYDNAGGVTVSDPGANSGGFTKFLGRFGGLKNVETNVALTGTQTSVNVNFDFYRIDSWDYESLNVRIIDNDGNDLFNTSDQYNHFDNGANYIYSGWSDNLHNYDITLATNTTSIKVVISAFLDSGIDDESFGIDNFRVSDDLVAPPQGGVPEPASWAMMLAGFGAIGGALRTRRKAAFA